MTGRTGQESAPAENNESRRRIEGLTRTIADALEALRLAAEHKPDRLHEPDEERLQQMPGDLAARLATLHTRWDISRGTVAEEGPSSLSREDWFRQLAELNTLWDVRSRVEDTGLADHLKKEISAHYPAILEQFLGGTPAPADGARPDPRSLRERMAEDLRRLHENWHFDREDAVAAEASHGFRAKIRDLIKRFVRLYTDRPFQRQRDYNAWLVETIDKLIAHNDLFEQRMSRILLEMTNRQFHFNLTLVRFVNTLMQEVILTRQREFNAEIVQTVQDILIELPSLVLERTEILIERLEANLTALTIALEEKNERNG